LKRAHPYCCSFRSRSINPEVSRHLNMLARALAFFATKGVEPSVEFVVAISHG